MNIELHISRVKVASASFTHITNMLLSMCPVGGQVEYQGFLVHYMKMRTNLNAF